VLGAGRALAGQAFVGVWVERPGEVVHGAEGRVSIGDPAGGVTARARALHALVARGWEVDLAEDIVFDQWKKLLWNAGFNALCAITGATAGEALALPASAETVRAAMREVVAVAARHGIALGEEDLAEMSAPNPALAGYRPSTARDLAAGKPVERDALCGFLAREGARLGVAVPVNQTLDALLGLRAGARPG
jgi:2-dehydropantoate 2-reductase